MTPEWGLRERKKEQTRLHIAQTARRLFSERGFDAATVAEIARAADVSEATLFNYFPTKEDLFYSGMEAFEALLVDAVRDRPRGETVLAAFRRVVLRNVKRLAEPQAARVIAEATGILATSAALRAREREIVAHYTDELSAVIVETSRHRDDIEAHAVASALMGAQRTLVRHVRARVLAGWRGPKLATDATTQASKIFRRLASGLNAYAAKR
jgi:AcrR family transcriptional regulator